MSKAAKKKEEERVEKIIRYLLKLPENRKCINCTSLGPQYVCTTFWTFVCTNCSGLHREFTHRVKSVSMAKFSAEEVSALQAGGNQRAWEIYFKVWDPRRHTFPDGSDQNRLRDFIRQVYVDRKYTGESTTKVATMKMVDAMEDDSGRQSVDNPRFGGRIESGSKYHIDERNPRYKKDTGKSRNCPSRFEIVDDRFRDEEFCRWRRSDTQRVYNAESRSPVALKTQEKTSPPAVRSFKDVLGEDIQPPREEKCPEDNNDAKNNKNTDPQEKPVFSSAKGAVDAKPPEVTREKSFSLIDLMADPEPSDLAAAPQRLETSSSVGANEGLIKSPRNASNASQVNSLELMLFELSDPPSGQVPCEVDIPNAASVVGEIHEASPGGTESILPCSSGDHMIAGNDGSHLTSSGDISSTTQQLIPSAGTSSNQAWSSLPAPNPPSSSSASVIESFQPDPSLAHNITSQTGPRASSTEAKPSGRGELPANLFTGSYPSFQAPVQNWQFRPPHGMGFSMYQHYVANSMPCSSFPNLARSRNPFDLSDTVTQAQTPMIQYPSMLPVQDAAPNLPAHQVLLNASHMNSPQFMQSQASPYQAMPPTQIPTYEIFPVPGAFSGQQFAYGMPFLGSQGDNGVACTGQQKDPFAALSPIRQHTEGGETTKNSFPSTGGNPFG